MEQNWDTAALLSEPDRMLTAFPKRILAVKPFESPQPNDKGGSPTQHQLSVLKLELSTINLMDAGVKDPCSLITGFRTKKYVPGFWIYP